MQSIYRQFLSRVPRPEFFIPNLNNIRQLRLYMLDAFFIFFTIFSLTFRRKKVELLSSLRRQRLGWLSFLSRVHFSKTIKGIHLKLGKLVHYQKRNQLQQGR